MRSSGWALIQQIGYLYNNRRRQQSSLFLCTLRKDDVSIQREGSHRQAGRELSPGTKLAETLTLDSSSPECGQNVGRDMLKCILVRSQK